MTEKKSRLKELKQQFHVLKREGKLDSIEALQELNDIVLALREELDAMAVRVKNDKDRLKTIELVIKTKVNSANQFITAALSVIIGVSVGLATLLPPNHTSLLIGLATFFLFITSVFYLRKHRAVSVFRRLLKKLHNIKDHIVRTEAEIDRLREQSTVLEDSISRLQQGGAQ